MLKEGSCNVVLRASRRLGSDGRQYVSVVALCRSCGAGSIKTLNEDGTLRSFTTTGSPFENCGAHGDQQLHVQDWPALPPTPSDTRGQHG